MSWRDDQCLPDIEAINCVLLNAICPVLGQIKNDTGQTPYARFTIGVYGQQMADSGMVSPMGRVQSVEESDGEIRIWFRRTLKKERMLFHVEAVLTKVAVGTGFSGFNLRGAVRLGGDGPVVDVPGVTFKYNQYSFVGPR